MYLRMAKRLLLETDKRLLWKLAWNFGFKGMLSVERHKRRSGLEHLAGVHQPVGVEHPLRLAHPATLGACRSRRTTARSISGCRRICCDRLGRTTLQVRQPLRR